MKTLPLLPSTPPPPVSSSATPLHEALPKENLQEIGSLLPNPALAALAKTNRHFHTILSSQLLFRQIKAIDKLEDFEAAIGKIMKNPVFGDSSCLPDKSSRDRELHDVSRTLVELGHRILSVHGDRVYGDDMHQATSLFNKAAHVLQEKAAETGADPDQGQFDSDVPHTEENEISPSENSALSLQKDINVKSPGTRLHPAFNEIVQAAKETEKNYENPSEIHHEGPLIRAMLKGPIGNAIRQGEPVDALIEEFKIKSSGAIHAMEMEAVHEGPAGKDVASGEHPYAVANYYGIDTLGYAFMELEDYVPDDLDSPLHSPPPSP